MWKQIALRLPFHVDFHGQQSCWKVLSISMCDFTACRKVTVCHIYWKCILILWIEYFVMADNIWKRLCSKCAGKMYLFVGFCRGLICSGPPPSAIQSPWKSLCADGLGWARPSLDLDSQKEGRVLGKLWDVNTQRIHLLRDCSDVLTCKTCRCETKPECGLRTWFARFPICAELDLKHNALVNLYYCCLRTFPCFSFQSVNIGAFWI